MIFNRTTKRATDLSSQLPQGKTTVVDSLETVSTADIIFTCVGDDKAIIDTIASLVKNDVKGKLFVDCSTVHPDTTGVLSKTIEAQGASFVACPGMYFPHRDTRHQAHQAVFGAPAMADNGQLVCVLAGPSAEIEKVKPFCKGIMARANIEYPDQAPGKATLLKVIGNTLVLNMVEALSEGHTLAEKSGLGGENLHQFLEIMFPAPYAAYSKRMMSGDYYNREEVR